MFRVAVRHVRPAARLAFLTELPIRGRAARHPARYTSGSAVEGARLRRPARAASRRCSARSLRRSTPTTPDRLSPSRINYLTLGPAGRRAVHRRRSAGDAGPAGGAPATRSRRRHPGPRCAAGQRVPLGHGGPGERDGRPASRGLLAITSGTCRIPASRMTTGTAGVGPRRLEAGGGPGDRASAAARGQFLTATLENGVATTTGHPRITTSARWGLDAGILPRLLDRARRADRKRPAPARPGAAAAHRRPVRAPASSRHATGLTPRFFVAGRADRLTFSPSAASADSAGQPTPWDAPVTRIEAGGGVYPQRNLTVRLVAQRQLAGRRPGEEPHLRVGQLAYWF